MFDFEPNGLYDFSFQARQNIIKMISAVAK
jgi:hypothetical protein